MKIQNDLLMILMPPAICLGIIVDYKKPQSFENTAAEEAWMEKSRKRAIELKFQLLTGLVEIEEESISDRIIIEPNQNDIPVNESKRFLKELVRFENASLMEQHFLGACATMHECLTLRSANIGRTLIILRKFKSYKLTKLMLLRNPDCVEIVRRLRRYVGNLAEWKMNARNTSVFKKNAEIIRKVSSDIYDGFKKIFECSETDLQDGFWNYFSNEVEDFDEYTEFMGKSLRSSLDESSYKYLIENQFSDE